MEIVVVKKLDLSFDHIYEADELTRFGGPWGKAELFQQAIVPDGLVSQEVVAVVVPEQWVLLSDESVVVTEAPTDGELYRHEPEHIALVADAAKQAAYAAKQAEEAQAQQLQDKKERREAGLQVIDFIQVLNEAQGLDVAQTLAFLAVPEVQQIQSLLSVGALESARDLVSGLVLRDADGNLPSGETETNSAILLKQEDQALVISKLNEALA